MALGTQKHELMQDGAKILTKHTNKHRKTQKSDFRALFKREDANIYFSSFCDPIALVS